MTDSTAWTDPLPVDMHDTGLLWLVNRVVFHPRGFALGMAYAGNVFTGFMLYGAGSEPNSFVAEDEPELFAAAERLFAAARRKAEAP